MLCSTIDSEKEKILFENVYEIMFDFNGDSRDYSETVTIYILNPKGNIVEEYKCYNSFFSYFFYFFIF